MTYIYPMDIEFIDLALLAHLERDTIKSIRVSLMDYHRMNHPAFLITPDDCTIPIEPSCEVPRGTVQTSTTPPSEPVAAMPGTLKRLLARMNPLRRHNDD